MVWYYYSASFFSVVFLANFVPHFVHGISGDRFPTPFAKSRGRGLSSPAVNVIWALFNLIASGTYCFAQEGSLPENIHCCWPSWLALRRSVWA
jgi:hypothetical protein